MNKNEAIENVKKDIRFNGFGCLISCEYLNSHYSGYTCLICKEPLDACFDIDLNRGIIQRTETCKALFKED